MNADAGESCCCQHMLLLNVSLVLGTTSRRLCMYMGMYVCVCFHLSGGERNRLHLACVLKQSGNLLLLDEPSNDLDVETLRCVYVRERVSDTAAGCLVV